MRQSLRSVVLVLPLLLAGAGAVWAQQPDGAEGSLLTHEIEDALQHARAGGRAGTVRGLQNLAAEALKMNDQENWAWAQTGVAEQWLLAEEEGEWIQMEPLKMLTEVLRRCSELGISSPLTRARAAQAACLLLLDDPIAAAQAWEHAGSLALEARQFNPSMDFFLRAARIYRDQGHAARVRASESWLDTLVQAHGTALSAANQEALAAFTASAQSLLALTPAADLTEAAPTLSLQPQLAEISVASSEQELGRCRFTLTNFTTKTFSRPLVVSAEHGQLTAWKSDGDALYLTLRPHANPVPEQRALRVLPGERLKVFVDYRFSEPNQNFQDTVKLSWGSESATAHFHFVAGPATRSQVINASRSAQTAGWPVPFYHEIYYRGQVLQVEDVLATASSPARVEIYNEDTGALLAIDAEGDGRYDGPNDLLPSAHDRNADTRPDLVVGPENPVGSLEIYLFPTAPVAPSTKLSLSLADYSRTPARWRVDSRDEQLPSAPAR